MTKKNQKRKFAADLALQEAKVFPIFTNDREELALIDKHDYPRDRETMKRWAHFVLSNAEIPIPKSPCNTWYIQEENGKWTELADRGDSWDHIRAGKKTGTVASFLKDDEHSMEYAAIRLLEDIELLEDARQKNEVNAIEHYAIHATAAYMEIRYRMSHSEPILEKLRRWSSARTSRIQNRKSATDQRIKVAYLKLTKNGQTDALQKRIAREVNISTKTVQRWLKQQKK